MWRKLYFIVIKKEFVRDMQIFAPDCTNEQWEELSEEDIYLFCELEYGWRDWEGQVFLCTVTAERDKLPEKIKEIAGKYRIPEMVLEAISVKEIMEKSGGLETVFGRDHDSRALIKQHGCEGYMQMFFEFLQGKFHPDNITARDIPNLSREQAWHMIYCMQEYFGIFDDRFECCKECGNIYDSFNEGAVISQETEPIKAKDIFGNEYIHHFTQEEYGNYCEECRPD